MHISLTRTASLALVSMVFVLAAALRVRAGGSHVIISTGSFSGSVIAGYFDFDHPDESTPAFSGTFAGKDSRFGKFTGQSVTEVTPDGQTCTPPSGVPGTGAEFTFANGGGGSVVIRDDGGDLHFDTVTDFTQCLDPSSGAYSFIFHDTTTGGTGKFQGATGTLTATGTGAILAGDASPYPKTHFFGWDQATYTMTLTILKH